MANNNPIKILKELKKEITQIQHIMVSVSTNGEYSIQDCEETYKNLHFSIESNIDLLENLSEKYRINLVHMNPFNSLNHFYSYWKSKLPSYPERREYISSLYLDTENKINKLIIKFNNEDYDVEPINTELYLKIENVPDDFYRQLIDLINECHAKEIYAAVPIFSRKLLESLIVDILKKKYGNDDVTIFFDRMNRRYHGFNNLLRTFEASLSNFEIDMSLDKNFIREISKFRENGNVNVHVLELDIKKDKSMLDSSKDNLNYIVKKLIRLEKVTVPKNQS